MLYVAKTILTMIYMICVIIGFLVADAQGDAPRYGLAPFQGFDESALKGPDNPAMGIAHRIGRLGSQPSNSTLSALSEKKRALRG